MLKTIVLISAVIAFIYPLEGSWAFLAIASLLEGYLLLLSWRKPSDTFGQNIQLTDKEKQLIDQYSLYFTRPHAARSLSTTMSLIALVGVVLFLWFLYQQLWLQAILVFGNYFLSQNLSAKLNIRFYLHDAVEIQHKEEYREKMELVDSVCKKIT
ncbi:MAG: hypothetical protein ACI9UJ_001681 [bacterium]|jgi:hypothetical protein